MKSKARDGYIDFAKGCAIIAMVVGHVCADRSADTFVNLFHMPFFLMASGFFFNCQKVQEVRGLRSFTISRFWRLYFPYVLWTFAFVCFNNLLLNIHFLVRPEDVGQIYKQFAYSSYLSWHDVPARLLKVLLMHDWTQFTGSCWFLVYLLYVSVGYAIVTCLLKRRSLNVMFWQTILALACCVFGRYASWHSFFGMFKIGVGGRIFVCYALFHLGVMLRNVDMANVLQKRLSAFFSFLISLGVLIALYLGGCRIGIFMNQYNNAFVLILASLSGWVMLYSSAFLVKGFAERIFQAVVFVGRCTMLVLIFHRLAIAIVNCALVHAFDLPLVKIAARPTAFSGIFWDCIFIVAGVLMPLLIHKPYQCLCRHWDSRQ